MGQLWSGRGGAGPWSHKSIWFGSLHGASYEVVKRCRGHGTSSAAGQAATSTGSSSSSCSHSEGSVGTSLVRRIQSGQQALRAIRMRVTGLMLFLGLTCGLLFDFPLRAGLKDLRRHRCSPDWSNYVLGLVGAVLFYGRVVFLALAPLPDDRVWTVVVILLEVAVVILLALGILHESPRMMYGEATAIIQLVLAAFFSAGAVGALTRRTASDVQSWMWRMISLWLVCNFLETLVMATLRSVKCHTVNGEVMFLPVLLLTIAIVVPPSARRWLQGRLGAVLALRTERQAAAGIAGLVGGWPAAAALAEAGGRFKTVSLSELTADDLRDNTPSPALASRSSPTALSQCDAFVSHSWHDDAGAKWEALQNWRRAFVKEHGHEPRIWFDKCCIDQTDIASDLRCLPIFLAGSRRLVVLCGVTFLERLWCVMEIFTFVHMGRSVDLVEFIPVCRPGGEDGKEITRQLRRFHAMHCECFVQSDKVRMLEIINVAFGCLEVFNTAVRGIFSSSDWGAECLAVDVTSSCSTAGDASDSGDADDLAKDSSDRRVSIGSTVCGSDGELCDCWV